MVEATDLWKRYCTHYVADRAQGFSLDISRVRFEESFLDRMRPAITKAMRAMRDLEAGAIANPDESRMVGHYWLRDPEIAPSEEIRAAIRAANDSIKAFAREVHDGTLKGAGGTFRHVLHIGIGGSALGPQFLSHALGGDGDRMAMHFLDNTDPDGIDRVLKAIGEDLGRTLVTVVSKSGSTPEPRNGMLEAQAAFRRAGLDFASQAVAITMDGSRLAKMASEQGWLRRFPMWDWVGGRTSILSPVGLVPAALQGLDIDAFLGGAAAMDRMTRAEEPEKNPAALLALMWHHAGGGRGKKDMVILPYKDRLVLFSRYLQQLVMESLGKELDRRGARVQQGIAVYGNKGSTDQHAYVQQLRDGVPNFFATFLQVLEDRSGPSPDLENGATAGDFLCGFLLGTRRALYENGRDSITITIDRVSPTTIGALIALYDRAVGLYAELVDINAYHQPGVEAGKVAAASVLELQRLVVEQVKSSGAVRTAEEIAAALGRPEEAETVFKILEHLAAGGERGIAMDAAATPDRATFRRA